MRLLSSALALLLGLLLAACTPDDLPPDDAPPDTAAVAHEPVVPLSRLDSLFADYRMPATLPQPVPEAEAQRWADSVLATLSLDEKIGQLFIVDLETRGLKRLLTDAGREAIEDYGVGGVLVPRVLPPERVYRRMADLQERAKLPLFVAADYERGAGRFDNAFTELPSNMALGATRDTLWAAAAGRLSALESRVMGVNLLFAPVVDVNNNPRNPIINIRSYGEDPALVGRMAAAFVAEAERHALLTTLKHFPGHGNTTVDTHAKMGVVEGDRAALDAVELAPYRQVFGRTMPAAVMSTHLWIQALDDEALPATFSRHALRDLLRDELGFTGLVVTDDVKMGALQNTYSLAERVIRPLEAGADIVLTPEDVARAVAAVKEAVGSGRLDEATLDAAARRVLTAKARAGLHRQRTADEATYDHFAETPRGEAIARAIADRSITLLKTAPVLPLGPDAGRMALVQLTNYEGSESIGRAMDHFGEALGADDAALDVRFDDAPSAREQARVLEAVRQADVVVLALYMRLRSGRGDAGLGARQKALATALVAQGTPVVFVTFGNPYAVTTFANADAHVVAYDQTLHSVEAVAAVLQGRQSAPGRLPITVTPYPFGAGLSSVNAE